MASRGRGRVRGRGIQPPPPPPPPPAPPIVVPLPIEQVREFHDPVFEQVIERPPQPVAHQWPTLTDLARAQTYSRELKRARKNEICEITAEDSAAASVYKHEIKAQLIDCMHLAIFGLFFFSNQPPTQQQQQVEHLHGLSPCKQLSQPSMQLSQPNLL